MLNKKRWKKGMRRTMALAFAATLLLAGCRGRQDKQTAGQAKPAATKKAVAADTTPEMPAGFKSIHQLELEAHRDTTADTTSARPPQR